MRDFSARRSNKRKSSPLPKRLIIATILVLVVYGVWGRVSRAGTPPDSPVTVESPSITDGEAEKLQAQEVSLESTVRETADKTWKNYSIYIQDLNSQFSYGINESVVYTAASINKITFLAALYALAQDNPDILDRSITIQEDDIQAYGTGVIQNDPPGGTYSVKTLARLMMQKSDNTAAYIIANHIIGLSRLQQMADDWNLRQTDVYQNKTSNKDMSTLLQLMYRGAITTPSLTDEMLSFLTNSDFEDRIPALLPDDAVVYHKIGNAEGGFHDVGIVVTPTHAYYIGMFTIDIEDHEMTIQAQAEISRLVYDFFHS